MEYLGFKFKEGDHGTWIRPVTGFDGIQLYEYVLLYADDCFVVSDDAEKILRDRIDRYLDLKPESIGPPSLYLGGHLRCANC